MLDYFKRYILLVLAFFSTVASSHAQIITIYNELMQPAEGVTLMSKKPRAMAITNAKGQTRIDEFKGSESIEIRYVGHATELLSYDELSLFNFSLALKPSPFKMDEVVISATRWQQSTREVPSKITSLDAKKISLYNPQTSADMLGQTGEVFIQKSQQGGGSPMIRGFSANRLLYSVDGVRMNTAIFRSGNLHNVISLDPFAMENVEVLFGPGSVIYGSDALGGVMSFSTLAPKLGSKDSLYTAADVALRYSSANNEITRHVHFNLGLNKWAFLTSYTWSDFGDMTMGRYGPEEYLRNFVVKRIDDADVVLPNANPRVQNPSGYTQHNLMQKIRYKPDNHWEFQYAFHYSTTTDFSRYDRLIETRNNQPRSAVWNYGPQKWLMNMASITHKEKLVLYDQASFRLANQYFEESRIDRPFGRNRLRTQTERVNAYSANLDFQKSFFNHRWYYGMEWVLNQVNSRASAIDISNDSAISVADRYPNSSWASYAAYVNYQYLLSDEWTFQTGIRYNAFTINSDFSRHLQFFPLEISDTRIQNNAPTGSIGLVYKPAPSWRFTSSAGVGFRSPNVDDIGKIFDPPGGGLVVPNTQLSAEYAYNAEFNISKVFDKHLKLDFSGFYTYLDNAMVRRPFQVNGQDSMEFNGEQLQVLAIQNAAFGTVYGFHAGIEWNFLKNFLLTSRYNYQLGREEMDNGEISRSRHAAPAFGQTRVTFQKKNLLLMLWAQYSAEVSYENLNVEERDKPAIYAQDAQGNPYSPAWYTLNFTAQYVMNQNFTITGSIENISDQRYRPYSSGLVAAGRNFVFSLRMKI